jgi:hypothetical protein
MLAEPMISAAVCSALRAALLLTGNAVSAENVILEAISSLDHDLTAEGLLSRAIEISIPAVSNCDRADLEAVWPDLPLELLSVLQLHVSLRICFVLRVLLGLPEEICARLLQLSTTEVGAKTCKAMNRLAAPKQTNPELTSRFKSHEALGERGADRFRPALALPIISGN